MARGRRPRYVEQVFNIVKESGYILQLDAAKLFNMQSSSGLDNSVKKLIDDDKIKRTKVKVRYQNGNLNEAWLLYLPTIDYNVILDYERELVNRPFKSPLKEHHCYKADVSEPEIVTITENTRNRGEVIDMQEYLKINDYELLIKEYRGQRVVTTKDIAKAHNKTIKGVNQQLERNKEHLIENEDYFILTKEESKVTGCDFEKYFTSNSQKKVHLITESGYLLLVKSFVDKLSWTIQRQLLNTYFKMKQLAEQNESQPIQTGQIQSLDIMEMMIKEMRKERERVDQIEEKLNKIVSILTN